MDVTNHMHSNHCRVKLLRLYCTVLTRCVVYSLSENIQHMNATEKNEKKNKHLKTAVFVVSVELNYHRITGCVLHV